ALRELAYEEAVRLFRVALRTLDLFGASTERRIDDLLGLGDAEGRAGDLEGSRVTFRRARDLAREASSPERLALAALGHGGRFGWSRNNRDPELVPTLEEALEQIGPADSSLRARVLARLAGAHRDDWSREPRDSMSAEAVAIARRLGDPATLAIALEIRFRSTWWVENAEDRLVIGNELVELAAHTHDRERVFEAHLARCDALWELGRTTEARAELEVAARAARELGQPAQLNMIMSNQAVDAFRAGHLAEAEELTSRAVLIGAGSEGPEAVVAHRMQMFLIRREQGRVPEIEADLLGVARQLPNRWVLGCVVAALHAERGRVAAAKRALHELGDGDLARLPLDNEYLFGVSLLPEVCAIAGDEARAAQLHALLLPFRARNSADLQDADTGSIELPLGRLAVQLGWRDLAIEHFTAAIAANEREGASLWVAWSSYELGRILATDPDPDTAARGRARIGEAADAARAMGLVVLEARAREALAVPA
ncbi:MAG TPA: hypothetical protein VF484_08070, partial [Candidatus Limnocylindrales bacterium]